jgi:hypothetical protein
MAQMIPAVQATRNFDSRTWLASIRRSPLLIAGGADTAVPAHHAQMLTQGIRGAQLEVIAGAGHLLLPTHTDQFVRLIEAFLGSGSAGDNTARSSDTTAAAIHPALAPQAGEPLAEHDFAEEVVANVTGRASAGQRR